MKYKTFPFALLAARTETRGDVWACSVHWKTKNVIQGRESEATEWQSQKGPWWMSDSTPSFHR